MGTGEDKQEVGGVNRRQCLVGGMSGVCEALYSD
jgi:hypothetical protein